MKGKCGPLFDKDDKQRFALALIDAELRGAAENFRMAASQLENFVSDQPSKIELALSKIDMERVLKRVAERLEIQKASHLM